MIKKVAFTVYPVLDIKRARCFYENTLELVPSNILSEGAWVEYDFPGGGCFAITSLDIGVKPSKDFGGSIAFEVEDLEIMVLHCRLLGVKFKFKSFSRWKCRMAVILDSEGNSIVLHQLKKAKPTLVGAFAQIIQRSIICLRDWVSPSTWLRPFFKYK